MEVGAQQAFLDRIVDEQACDPCHVPGPSEDATVYVTLSWTLYSARILLGPRVQIIHEAASLPIVPSERI